MFKPLKRLTVWHEKEMKEKQTEEEKEKTKTEVGPEEREAEEGKEVVLRSQKDKSS